MRPTVLFDLDDTLLCTNMDRFLPGYFEILGQALDHIYTHERIIQQIQFAVQKMIVNLDPTKTLKQVFDQHFYQPLGTTVEACKQTLNTFYRDEYPHLKPITRSKPAASQLVEWCRSNSMAMAVATNPLFPKTATRQRIQWAELNPDDFLLFTTYDDFHFTKPHLSYYAEVLGRLGWPQGPVVMVGDNLTHDLIPMDTMGYATFWVHPKQEGVHSEGGTLKEVIPWLTRTMEDNNHQLNDHPEVNLAILQSTPAVLDTWLRQRSSMKLNNKIINHVEEFNQLLAHFGALEKEVFYPQLEKIKSDPQIYHRKLDQIDQEPKGIDLNQSPQENFSRFLKFRQKSLSILSGINDLDLLSAPLTGPMENKPLIIELLSAMANNDRMYLRKSVNLLNIYKIY